MTLHAVFDHRLPLPENIAHASILTPDLPLSRNMTDHVELQAFNDPTVQQAGEDMIVSSEDKLKANATIGMEAISSSNQSLVQRDEDASWKPSRAEILIVVLLAVLSFMVALDATIIVPALPVRTIRVHLPMTSVDEMTSDDCQSHRGK